MIKIVDIEIPYYEWDGNLSYKEDDINCKIETLRSEGYMFQDIQIIPPSSSAYEGSEIDSNSYPATIKREQKEEIVNGKIILIFKQLPLKQVLESGDSQ